MTEVVLPYWMGLDVSSKTFDAALVGSGQHYPDTPLREVPAKSFSRDPQGVAQCLAWMGERLRDAPEVPTVRVVMEATGRYSLELCVWLSEQCPMLAPAIVNPEQTSAFVKSMSLRNKTDRLDARALAFYGAERRPAPYEPLSPEQRQLRELSRYRDALIKESVAQGNREEQPAQTKLLRTIQAQRERQRQRDIQKVEKEMKRLIDNTPQLKQDYELLISIPGVAFVTAAVILAEMGDLRRFARARQAAAFAGVTPRQAISGSSVHARPRMSKKGNARVRQALYLAAMVTVRFNPLLRAKYEAMLQQGKRPMVALGAIMRKLLTLMRALLVANTKFHPQWKTSEKIPA